MVPKDTSTSLKDDHDTAAVNPTEWNDTNYPVTQRSQDLDVQEHEIVAEKEKNNNNHSEMPAHDRRLLPSDEEFEKDTIHFQSLSIELQPTRVHEDHPRDLAEQDLKIQGMNERRWNKALETLEMSPRQPPIMMNSMERWVTDKNLHPDHDKTFTVEQEAFYDQLSEADRSRGWDELATLFTEKFHEDFTAKQVRYQFQSFHEGLGLMLAQRPLEDAYSQELYARSPEMDWTELATKFDERFKPARHPALLLQCRYQHLKDKVEIEKARSKRHDAVDVEEMARPLPTIEEKVDSLMDRCPLETILYVFTFERLEEMIHQALVKAITVDPGLEDEIYRYIEEFKQGKTGSVATNDQ